MNVARYLRTKQSKIKVLSLLDFTTLLILHKNSLKSLRSDRYAALEHIKLLGGPHESLDASISRLKRMLFITPRLILRPDAEMFITGICTQQTMNTSMLELIQTFTMLDKLPNIRFIDYFLYMRTNQFKDTKLSVYFYTPLKINSNTKRFRALLEKPEIANRFHLLKTTIMFTIPEKDVGHAEK